MMKTNDLPLITIIVPVYNAAQYLPKCIESILAQTYTHFELLLLDDGSKDNSLEICNDYAKQDTRIKVFSHSNMGVSATRNRGIEYAQGEYISFVDSDDWVKSSYLQVLYDALQPNLGRGLVIAGFEKCSKNNIIPVLLPTISLNQEQTKDIALKYLNSDIFYTFGKLFDKSLIIQKNLRFMTEISCCEDLFFILDYANYTGYIHIIGESVYYYRVGENASSLSAKIYSYNHEVLTMNGLLQRLEQYQMRSGNIGNNMNYASRTITGFLHKILISIYKNHYNRSTRMRYLHELTDNYQKYITNHYNPDYLADKIGAYLIRNKLLFFFDIWQSFLFGIKFPKMFGA